MPELSTYLLRTVIKPLRFFSFTLAAKTIATLPFIPGHECVGEVLRQNTSDS